MGMTNHFTLILNNEGRLMTNSDYCIFIWDKSFKSYKELIISITSNRILLQLKNNMIACESFLNYLSFYDFY